MISLIFIISIILLWLAPDYYNYIFCVAIFILFVLNAYIVIKKTAGSNKNYFNFHVLFSISYLFVNFVYPVFLYPVDPGYFPVFKNYGFDENLISVCTALAQVGYASYSLGCSLYFSISNKNKESDGIKILNNTIYLKSIANILLILFLLLTFIIFSLSKDGVFNRDPFAFFNVPPTLMVFTQVVLTVCILLTFIYESKKKKNRTTFFAIAKSNKMLFIAVALYIIMFIYPGDRGPAIQTVLTIIFSYSLFFSPIRVKTLLIVVAIGMFILTFISYSRSAGGGFFESGIENTNISTIADVGMDLIVNNRNLYVGYEIVEKEGINYGKSMAYYLLSPFPLLPTLMTNYFYGVEPIELSTSNIITKYSNGTYGLGTNLVIDLYMQFSYLGVILFLMLLGFIICKISSLNNISSLFALTFFMSYSIYMSRSSMFDSVRFIVWAIFIFYFLYYLLKPLSYASK